MFIAKWIEGERNLEDFCTKRFGELPRFCETIGHVGEATVHLIYKYKGEGIGYVAMYMLFMRHHSGTYTYSDIMDMEKMTYEQIKADRTAILV